MELIQELLSFVLHIDDKLSDIIAYFGAWTYVLMFAIIFAETGLVVTPILPGDSLLFALGAFAAKGDLSLMVMMVSLIVAAILGDSVNYAIGKFIGPRVFTDQIRFLNRKHLERTHEFFEKYGGKTIIIARFVPIVRTFAPFVAGVGSMTYSKFIFYNVVGALMWVPICLLACYFFGNLPFVKKNLTLVIFGIIGLSLLPMVVEYVRAKRATRSQLSAP